MCFIEAPPKSQYNLRVVIHRILPKPLKPPSDNITILHKHLTYTHLHTHTDKKSNVYILCSVDVTNDIIKKSIVYDKISPPHLCYI